MTDVLKVTPFYCSSAFTEEGIERIIRVALDGRERSGLDFDTIVGTGLSGSLVVPRLAAALNVSWAVVRKANDGSHSPGMVQGHVGRRWLFVDDFISTGDTLRRVVGHMATLTDAYRSTWSTELVGAYVYSDACYEHVDSLGL